MKILCLIFCFFPLTLCAASPAEVYRQWVTNIVIISNFDTNGDCYMSGGVIIGDKILACYHSVKEAEIFLEFYDKSKATGTIVRSDKGHDLAIILPSHLPSASCLKFEDLPMEIGDVLYQIGNYKQLPFSFSQGYVMYVDRKLEPEGFLHQMSIETLPGSSGSLVLTSDGRPIGLTKSIQINSTKITFAIQAVDINNFLEWEDISPVLALKADK